MNMAVYGSAVFLTWYTFMQARLTWREGNKKAGLGIALLSGSFLPLAVYLSMRS